MVRENRAALVGIRIVAGRENSDALFIDNVMAFAARNNGNAFFCFMQISGNDSAGGAGADNKIVKIHMFSFLTGQRRYLPNGALPRSAPAQCRGDRELRNIRL